MEIEKLFMVGSKAFVEVKWVLISTHLTRALVGRGVIR